MADSIVSPSPITSAPAPAAANTEAPKTAPESKKEVQTSNPNQAKIISKPGETPKTPTPEAKKPVSTKQKLQLKVDGQEFEEEYDPNDKEYITRNVQLAKVAQKRMQEYSALQKDVIQLINDLKNNPKKALSDPSIGLDVKKLAAQIIEEEIANSKKSPEQIQREQLEAELKEMKEQREKEKADSQAQEFERLREQQFERYDILMEQALEKTDLPKEPYVVKRIAEYMLLGLQEGKDVLPEDVIPLVREEILDDMKHMIHTMPVEAVESFLGKDLFDKMRRNNIAKVKAKQAVKAVGAIKAPDVGKVSSAKPEEPKKKMSYKDFFKVE